MCSSLQLTDAFWQAVPALLPLSPVKHVAAGVGFSALVAKDGDVYAFGVNLAGQLGQRIAGP